MEENRELRNRSKILIPTNGIGTTRHPHAKKQESNYGPYIIHKH